MSVGSRSVEKRSAICLKIFFRRGQGSAVDREEERKGRN